MCIYQVHVVFVNYITVQNQNNRTTVFAWVISIASYNCTIYNTLFSQSLCYAKVEK